MSNLIKGFYVHMENEEDGPHIIDSNEIFEKKLEEKRQREEMRAIALASKAGPEPMEDEFEGLDPDQLEQLTADQAMLGAASQEAAISSEELNSQIEAQLNEAREEAERIIAEANTQADIIRDSAANMGHDEGYKAGYQEAQIEAAKAEAELNHREKEMEDRFQKLVESVEPEMVDVLTRIYEHVFNIRFGDDKEIILHLLRQTLSRTEPSGDFLIHVSSADYETLIDAKEELKEQIPNANCNLEIVEDTLLKENECMVETDGGVFDCSLGTELSELTKKLKLLSVTA